MGIPAGDQGYSVEALKPFHHAMRKETPLADDEHDVADHHVRDVDVTDEENVLGPDGRTHACARHPHASFTDLPQEGRHELRRDAINL
jgi:hypothetical protein